MMTQMFYVYFNLFLIAINLINYVVFGHFITLMCAVTIVFIMIITIDNIQKEPKNGPKPTSDL